MHRQSWITGLIAFPILCTLIAKGGLSFFLLIAAASVLTLYEYYRAVFPQDAEQPQRLIPGIGLFLSPFIVWAVYRGHSTYAFSLVALDLIIVAALTLPLFKTDSQAPHLVGRQVLGLVYITVFLSFLVTIRLGPKGAQWIFLIICIVFAGDIGAFYTGTYLGRRKLCPWVSPKKTIEGSLGGLVSNIAVGLLFKMVFLPDLSILPCIGFSLAIGVAGQIGDLFASEFKRAAGIKDSGTLLPGHGGFLDRLDALLFASPLAYLLKVSIF